VSPSSKTVGEISAAAKAVSAARGGVHIRQRDAAAPVVAIEFVRMSEDIAAIRPKTVK
jgi:hypothetical protein